MKAAARLEIFYTIYRIFIDQQTIICSREIICLSVVIFCFKKFLTVPKRVEREMGPTDLCVAPPSVY